ncbi:conjugal transfer protein TraG N-terminal domain-containing protein (plasmid) [Psychrobium sp. nBUS_13]|uniref:conjugal transfer protein TraG N-terminal domain-containing protein n=1 Tax=Psychrobium sp. nBUS_13 TaxID=3395319 RepID=UPI003EB8CF5A
MDLTIYSIGDAQWLFFVLQGVARIFDYSNSPLSILVGASAALGLLSLVVSTWINPQSKPIESWFLGMLLFMILLGPLSKTNVTIESVRDGSVYSVDDVPAIASIAGFATSALMYGLSTAYEDNWGSVDGFKAGQFLDPYRALLKFDKFGIQMAYAEQNGIDPKKMAVESSLQNYMDDCVMWDIEQGGSSAELNKAEILNSSIGDVWKKLQVKTKTRSTLIAVNGVEEYITCADAFTKIDNFFGSAIFNNTVNDFMNREGITNDGVLTATEKITAGSALLTARGLATARVTSDALAAAAQKSNDNLKLNQEIILIQSKAQRHYQMGADRELWLELAVGFATFLEGFVYFMMPIMAIIMVLGGQMLKAIAGFFAVSIWVSLWPVTMVAVNFFTDFALSGAFAGTATNTALSFGMFSNSKETIESYLAVSSSLAAAVPMLSMYILHRGVHTMMGVGGKAAPNTSIDSSMSSPDIASINGGVVTEGNVKTAATTSSSNDTEVMQNVKAGTSHGARTIDKGSDNTINSMVTASSSSVNQNTNASARSETAKQELAKSRVKSAERVGSFLDSHGDGFTVSDALSAGLSTSEAAAALTVQKQSTENGLSIAEQTELNRSAGIGLQGGAKIGGTIGGDKKGKGRTRLSAGGSISLEGGIRSTSGRKASTTTTDGSTNQASQQTAYNALHAEQLQRVKSELNNNVSSYGESSKLTAQQSEVEAQAITASQQQQKTEAQMTNSLFSQSADNKELVQSKASNLTAKESLTKMANSLTPQQAERVNEENGFKSKGGETSNQTLARNLREQSEEKLKLAGTGFNEGFSPQAKQNAAALAVTTDAIKKMNATNRKLSDYPSVDALEQGNTNESDAKKAMFEHLGNEYKAPSYSVIAGQISTSGNADTREIDRANPELNKFSNKEDSAFNQLENKEIPENNIKQIDQSQATKDVYQRAATTQEEVQKQGIKEKDKAVERGTETSTEVLADTNKAAAGVELGKKLFGGTMIGALAADNSIPAIDKRMPGDSTFAGSGFQMMALAGGDVGELIKNDRNNLPLLHSANTPKALAAYEDAKKSGEIKPEVAQAIDAGVRGFEEYRNGNNLTPEFQKNEQAALFSEQNSLNNSSTSTAFSVAHGNDETASWFAVGGLDDKSPAIYSALSHFANQNGVDLPNEHYEPNKGSGGSSNSMMHLGNENIFIPNYEPGSPSSDRFAPQNFAKAFGDASTDKELLEPSAIQNAKGGLSVDDWGNMNRFIQGTEPISEVRSVAMSNFTRLASATSTENGGNGSWDNYVNQEQSKAVDLADVDGNTRMMIDNVVDGSGNFDDIAPSQVPKVQQVIESLTMSGATQRAQDLENELMASNKI